MLARTHPIRTPLVVVSALLASSLVASAGASVRISSVLVDAAAQASSGRNGSNTGLLVNDPPQTGVVITNTGGTVTTSAQVSAGPIPPPQPLNPSFPGTAGIATGSVTATVTCTTNATSTNITMSILASNSLVSMDGGGYFALGEASTDVLFSVTTPTPYTLSGTLAFDDEDSFGSLAVNGAGIFLFNLFNGPVTRTGTLAPGSYAFRGNAAVRESPVITIGAFSESSSFNVVLNLGAPLNQRCGLSDVAGPGPTVGADNELTADDIILFISWFTGTDSRADIAGPGPVAGADGEFTADDIILFISRFTQGC